MTWKPDYVTLADFKHFLKLDVNDTQDDPELSLAITAASRAIDTDTHRQFGRTAGAEQRYYTAAWDRHLCRWVVEIDDLMSTTGLTVVTLDSDGDPVGTIDAYVLEPRNAAQDGKPWTRLVVKPSSAVKPGRSGDMAITGNPWGWLAFPTVVPSACMLQAARFEIRRGSPFGVAGSAEAGTEIRLLSKVDPDVAVMLGSVRRAKL